MIDLKNYLPKVSFIILILFLVSCNNDDDPKPDPFVTVNATPSADYSTLLTFSGSKSSATGKIYEVLPGPSVINPAMSLTPFSDNIQETDGEYNLVVQDNVDVDSPASTDKVMSVNIEFTANDGKKFEIDWK